MAVATKSTTAPPGPVASTTMSSGAEITGAVVSTTVTSNVWVVVLPLLSEAVAVTVVLPSPKVLPEGGLSVTGTSPSRSSTALAANVTTAPAGPVASTSMSPGTVRTGARFGK